MADLSLSGEIVVDVCIVGAGIIGSATAYNLLLQKKNQHVLLMDQFPLPHTRGSSHGQSRVIRHSYGQQCYSEMMPECFREWNKIEEISGQKLFHKCGLLSIDVFPLESAKQVKQNLDAVGIQSDLLKGEKFEKIYSMLKYPKGTGAVLEHDGGVLVANKCGQAFRDLFAQHGGTIIDNDKVLRIVPGQIITVKTRRHNIRAKNVIITSGPWTSELTKQLDLQIPLQPSSINVCYWKTTDARYRADKGFPTFSDFGSGTAKKCQIYGLPCIEYPNMLKICLHHGTNSDPDSRDSFSVLKKDVIEIGKYIREHFENVEDTPSIVERCMYTSTPDDDFIIDRHPMYHNIVIGAGFSGHGFKLAPVVGKLLAELSLNKKPSYDMKPFKLDRFTKLKASL